MERPPSGIIADMFDLFHKNRGTARLRLHLRGAVRNVTGSCYILETPVGNLMIDCGLYQGNRKMETLNRRPFAFEPSDIRWVILTHAHIDHTGLVPRLVKEGYEGEIITHAATCDLADIMLRDSGYIQEEDAEYAQKRWRRGGKKTPPPPPAIYTIEDAEAAVRRLRPVPYSEVVDLCPEIRVRFIDAGHILGAAHVEVWLKDGDERTRITFSGDIGSGDSRIIREPQSPSACDYLVMESTYGNRYHSAKATRDERLRDAVRKTLDAQSTVVIPAFSVGRTQEIVYALNEMIERHELPEFQAFVDSPLAINATRIFQKHPECFNRGLVEDIMSGDDPFDFPNLHFTRAVEDSKAINKVRGANVIISASGMCTAGRIRHHLLNHLGNEHDLILFVGYQAQNTLGRRIRDGFSPVRIFGQQVDVKAQVTAIDGFSAHADRGQLLTWFGGIPEPPKYTIVTHGETEASFSFRDAIDKQMGATAIVPELGGIIDLVPENRALDLLMAEQRKRPIEEPPPEDEKRVQAPGPDGQA